MDSFIQKVDETKYNSVQLLSEKTVRNAQSSVIYPSGGRYSGTLANPINGEKIIFRLTNCGQMVWHKCALELSFYLTDTVGTAGAYGAVPPAFIIGKLISSIRAKFNGNSEEFYRSTTDDFYSEYVARMLTTYTGAELERHPNICGPLPTPEDAYLLASSRLSTDDAGGHAVDATVPSYVARFNRWVVARTGSHLRKIKMEIPFLDLFPRMYGCIRNLSDIQIEVELGSYSIGELGQDWNGGGGGATRDGQLQVRATECRVIRMDYIASPDGLLAQSSPNVLSYIRTEAYRGSISATADTVNEILISGIKNLQGIFIFNPANGQTNGKAGGDGRTYRASDQFFLVLNGLNAVNAARTGSDEKVTGDMQIGAQNLSVKYGNVEIPESSNSLVSEAGNQLTLERLYWMYRTGRGRACDEFRSLAVSPATFTKTQPFAYFAVNQSGYPGLASAADVRIKMKTTCAGGNINIVLFTLDGMQIGTDGSIKKIL